MKSMYMNRTRYIINPLLLVLFVLLSELHVCNFSYALYGTCDPYRRRSNPVLCASYTRQIAADPNKFWFGTVYDSICPVKAPDTRLSPCSDPPKDGFTQAQFQTLGSRLFSDTAFNAQTDLAGIIYPIDVTYVSPAGVVRGCNSSLVSNSNRYIDVQPDMYPVAAWHLRNPPLISSPGCTTANLCTIVMLDAGHMILHGAWANFPRDTALTGYIRPGHSSLTTNPYVFAAFRQADQNVTLDLTPFTAAWDFELRSFLTTYNLQGPIALTWVNAIGEIDSAQRLTDQEIQQNCPELLLISLYADRFQFSYDLGIVTPGALSFWIMAKFDTPQPRLQTCCNTITNEAWLDPIRNGILFAADIQTAPEVTIQARVRAPTDDDLAGKFTLMLVRLDDTIAFVYNSGSPGRVYINWLVYNSDGTDLTAGTEELAYQPPVALSGACSINRFYLLLFQQTGDIATVDSSLIPNCTPATAEKRCRFNLISFVSANNLTLVGVSRFRIPCTLYSERYTAAGFKTRDQSLDTWQLDDNPVINNINNQ